MRLLDSNIVIYATKPGYPWLAEALREQPFKVSVISEIEVMGYHLLTPEDRADLQAFLDATEILPLTSAIAQRAIALRQLRKMKLGDAVIAATALEEKCELLTRNVADFREIEG